MYWSKSPSGVTNPITAPLVPPRKFYRSSSGHGFVAQEEKLVSTKFSQRNRAPGGIQKFHLEHAGRMHLDHRPNLTGHQPISGLFVQQGNDIQEFDRSVLHGDFIARNR